MDLLAVVDQVIELLRSRGRVSYRVLKLQLQLDDDAIEALKDELIYAQHVAVDEEGRVLVWTGNLTLPRLQLPPRAHQDRLAAKPTWPPRSSRASPSPAPPDPSFSERFGSPC